MAFIGNQPAESFTSFATQEFSTSATTSYTLDHAVTNENEIALFINNVRQQPGSGKAYTATGTALTLSAATASTDTMYCVFLGRALQTVTPATNSITAAMVSNDLISGKDALTSAPADTDEFLISDAGTLKRIDFSLIKGETNSPYFRATQNSAQSISASTTTLINYDTVGYNIGGGTYDTTNKRYTPGVAGRYFVSAWVFIKYAVSTGQRIDLHIRKNGSNIIGARWRETGDLDGANSAFVQGIVTLDDNDYIDAAMFQTSGSSRSMDNNEYFTFFEGFLIAST